MKMRQCKRVLELIAYVHTGVLVHRSSIECIRVLKCSNVLKFTRVLKRDRAIKCIEVCSHIECSGCRMKVYEDLEMHLEMKIYKSAFLYRYSADTCVRE